MAQIAISQTWQLTGSGTNDWQCIASSANGQTVIAGQWPGSLAVSTNAGTRWTTNVTMNGYWGSLASSADGTKLLAASENIDNAHTNGVFLSTNSGVSWVSNSLPAYYWGSVAMSADGHTMAAVAPIVSGSDFSSVCAVFCSTNSGLNWVSNNINFLSGASAPSPVGVAMSADGRKIFVIAELELCYSTNFGASWMQMTSAPPSYAYASPSQYIASSADGNSLVLRVSPSQNPSFIYTSTNSGNTWTFTSLPETNWSFVASSANGKTLLASAGGFNQGPLFISTNSGASWTTNTSESWGGVACSADGSTLFAIAAPDAGINSGAIYKSQSISPPLLDVAPAGSEELLSWLIPSTNFVLQQSSNLNNWSAVTNSPALNPANLQEQILISPTNGVGLYRLASGPGN